MVIWLRWTGAVVMGICAAAGSANVRGNLLDTVEVTLTPTDVGGAGPFALTQDAAGGISMSRGTTGGLSSSAFGAAHVQPGIIELSGSAAGSIDVETRGVYRDMFTISAPGVATGTNGNLTIAVGIDGVMTATAGISQSRWILNAEVGGGALQLLATGNEFFPNSMSPGDPFDPFSTYFMVVPFQFGVATELEVELIGLAKARYDGGSAGAADFDFGQAMFWQGMLGIRPVGGTVVDDATLTSDTGVDWLEPVVLPVPEVGSGVAILAGALVVWRVGRRRVGKRWEGDAWGGQ